MKIIAVQSTCIGHKSNETIPKAFVRDCLSIRHPQRVALSPITEPDRESQVFGEHRFRTSPPGNLVWAMTLCRQGAGHLSAAITHHHPVAGASFVTKSSSPFQLVRQHISWCPWCPAQRCRSRLSRTSLSTHITLKIAFQTYLS